ncbi:hypothetical protein RDI58_023634 [Solanum bulbocastanum]
MRVVFFQ